MEKKGRKFNPIKKETWVLTKGTVEKRGGMGGGKIPFGGGFLDMINVNTGRSIDCESHGFDLSCNPLGNRKKEQIGETEKDAMGGKR